MASKAKVEKDTSERWLLTYSDLMNLLLILFIMLYTMANIDVEKYQQVAASLRAAFGDSAGAQMVGEGGGNISLIDLSGSGSPNTNSEEKNTVIPANMEEQQMKEVKETVTELVNDLGLQGEVAVTLQERGIFISIGEQVLFQSGSADIGEEARANITKIGREILAKIPGKQMRVEGHTDNVPISNSRFPDNQELSTARANSVWRVLVKDAGIDASKLSATGYGEFRPKVPNDTEEHRRQNRRVDIVILRDIYDTAEPSDTSTTGTN